MFVLVVILFIVLVALTGFLYTPVKFYIDTDQSRYEIFQLPVFHFAFIHSDDRFLPMARILGINIQLTGQQKKGKKRTKSTKHGRGLRRSADRWFYLIRQMIRSFKINQAVFDIDTGDVVLNAQLVPLFIAVSSGRAHFSSNFNGRIFAHVEMSNQPAKLFWIFIKFLIKK